MRKAKTEVAVLMGSDSDWPVVEHAAKTLREFGVGFEARVLSAHRTPDAAAAYARSAARRGLKVLVAAAGGAAHLAGAVAANTILPVIGIPVSGGALDGLDALLATVQMPSGVPVATVALGKAGAVNAALLAVQILALGRPDLRRRLEAHKRTMKKKVAAGNRRLKAAAEKTT
ncbi:MAG TPA: 5-(carboxyamino)imidazole ribonucleotide mutase [Kiritimatiellia bacterium]|nr:5-(carboxyamino)imidazole ribonucleotide mutase [Kiritimatiellia bacterium]HRZ13143.1 5-(carboxyamino)imidazole ribonucleotide mutase [Kiritimatiellia bacterium]HSA17564.1 5-(carboxyamino)imidazole ribonucleotide mutase [Kiritimatiellia bacterium]